VKVGDVVRAKFRTQMRPGTARNVDVADLDFVTGGPEFAPYLDRVGWLGVVHAVRGVGRGKKARRRCFEVDVLWGDGTLTTEVGPASHIQVMTEEAPEALDSADRLEASGNGAAPKGPL
jgi:hypothetical protein